jgi:hypothetical protein
MKMEQHPQGGAGLQGEEITAKAGDSLSVDEVSLSSNKLFRRAKKGRHCRPFSLAAPVSKGFEVGPHLFSTLGCVDEPVGKKTEISRRGIVPMPTVVPCR